MNAGALVTLGLIIMAVAWGIWLIFKQDPSGVNLAKLLSYFVGVIVTLLAILWVVSRFLPWWGVRLVQNTQQSGNVEELEVIGRQLWEDAMSTTLATATPVVGEITPEAPPVVTESPILPTATPAPETSLSGQSAGGQQAYIVKSGDTLYSIGRAFGVTVDAIKQQNGLSSDAIQVGQQLIIPAP